MSYTNRRNQTGTTTYDALDRIQSFTQAEGQTTTFSYDSLWMAVSNAQSADTVRLNAQYLVTKQITARAAGFKRTVRASHDVWQQRTGVNVLLNDAPGGQHRL